MVLAFSITQTEISGFELLEADREGQPGGARADGDDVVFHHVAFDDSTVVLFGFAHATLPGNPANGPIFRGFDGGGKSAG